MRRVAWPRGKVAGGSSAVNGLLWVRGQAADFDGWAAAVCDPRWSAASTLPRFERIEREMQVGPSRCGMQHTDRPTAAFIAAAAHLGVQTAADVGGRFRGSFAGAGASALQEGAGMLPVSVTPEGVRASSAAAYLEPALADSARDLELVLGAHVDRLTFGVAAGAAAGGSGAGGGRDNRPACTGVQYTTAGGTVMRAELEPGGEVVLAAGAIGSPHILLASGVGPPAQLERCATTVPLVSASPAVGQHLQDHLQIRANFRSLAPTLNDRVNSVLGLAKMTAEYTLRRTGPLTMSPTPAAAFVRSRSVVDRHCASGGGSDGVACNTSAPERAGSGSPGRPDLQLHFGPWTAADREVSRGSIFRALDPFSAFTITACQLRPTSSGSVVLASASTVDAPLIQPNFLSTEEDASAAVRAVRTLQAFARAPPLRDVIDRGATSSLLDGAVSDADALAYARANSSSIYHSAGTCRMGLHGHDSVVDAELRVHGVGSLRVADASIM